MSNLLSGYPQALLLLPLLPAVDTASTEHCDNHYDYHHFYQAEAELFRFHGVSVPAAKLFASGKKLFLEASRREVLLLRRIAEVLETGSQSRK